MKMTEDEKKKMREGFKKPVTEEEPDYWTDDRLIETAKRIIKKLGIKGELQ